MTSALDDGDRSSVMMQPTNQPTSWSRVLCEKLTVPQLVKKFSAFYGTWWFFTMFTEQPTTCTYPEPD